MGLRSINTGINPTLSRRDFLIAGLTATAAVALSGCNLKRVEDDQLSTEKLSNLICRQFGIKEILVVKNDFQFANYEISTAEFGYSAVTGTLENIYNQLCKYPPEFFTTIQPLNWGMYLAGDIVFTENGHTERCTGFSALNGNREPRIALNLSGTQSKIPITEHHEIFHHVTDNSTVIVSNPFYVNIDNRLEAINREAGLNGNRFSDYNQANNCQEQSPRGFASCYGQWNSNEDGAEIAERLMMGNQRLWSRTENDSTLRKKVIAVIDVYKELSREKMDEEYFGHLSEGQEEGFWDWPSIPAYVYS